MDTLSVFGIRRRITTYLAKRKKLWRKLKIRKRINKTRVSVDTVPTELINNPQWILWRPIKYENSFAKVPINGWGDGIDFNDEKNWLDFDTANEVRKSSPCRLGLGYVLRGNLLAIVLDNCIHEGVIENWAAEIMDYFGSYTEVSASGKGLNILLKGCLPDGGKRSDNKECFASKRFVAITGDILQGYEIIRKRQKRLNKWYSNTFPNIPPLANIPQFIKPSIAFPPDVENIVFTKDGERLEK